MPGGSSFQTRFFATDGTPAGTRALGEASGIWRVLNPLSRATVYAVRDNSAGAFELYRLDPDTGQREYRLNLGNPLDLVSRVEFLAEPTGGPVYFMVFEELVRGTGLWRTDGTSVGTVLLASEEGGAGGTHLGSTSAGDVFVLFHVDNGASIWVSDGSVAGTTKILGRAGEMPVFPKGSAETSENVFFPWNDPQHGTEIWISNGTQAGTHLYADIAPGALSSEPEILGTQDGRLIVSAWHPDVGIELWSIALPSVYEKAAAGDGEGGSARRATIPSILRTPEPSTSTPVGR